MVLKTEKEGALLAASKQFDDAIAKRDLSPFTDLLADDVVVHQDSVTLFHDLKGKKVVTSYFQVRAVSLLAPDLKLLTCNDKVATLPVDSFTLISYLMCAHDLLLYVQACIDRYQYEHVPIAGAVDENEDGGVAFSFSVDKGVVPKEGKYQQQHDAGEAIPADTSGEHKCLCPRIRKDRGYCTQCKPLRHSRRLECCKQTMTMESSFKNSFFSLHW